MLNWLFHVPPPTTINNKRRTSTTTNNQQQPTNTQQSQLFAEGGPPKPGIGISHRRWLGEVTTPFRRNFNAKAWSICILRTGLGNRRLKPFVSQSAGVIKLLVPILGESNLMQIYGSALFGLVIHHDPCIGRWRELKKTLTVKGTGKSGPSEDYRCGCMHALPRSTCETTWRGVNLLKAW